MKTNSKVSSNIQCDHCGRAAAQVRHVSRTYGKGADLLVVEQVPVVHCSHCEAVYLTADTLQEIDRIKSHRRSLTKRRSIAVAEFAEQV